MKGSTLAQKYVDALWAAQALIAMSLKHATDEDEKSAYLNLAVKLIDEVLAEA